MAGIRSAKQKAALRKAQLASARKRKGRGKAKSTAGRRRSVSSLKAQNVRRRVGAKSTSSGKSNRKRNIRRAAVAAVAVSTAVGTAGYVYKNRERLVIARKAEYDAVKRAKIKAGRKLTKAEKHAAIMNERRDHASRSTFRVREYLDARKKYRAISKWSRGKLNIRTTGNAGSMYDNRQLNLQSSLLDQVLVFKAYRRDVHSRANQRLNRMRRNGLSATRRNSTIGRMRQARAISQAKTRAFNYNSGKRLLVSSKGKVKQAFW